MKIFKFGGGSVKDARGVKNLAKIVSENRGDLVVVVSAFGKTTNAMELLLKLWIDRNVAYKEHLDNIYSYHSSIANELFAEDDPAREKLDDSFINLRNYMNTAKASSYDFEYDQIVSYGELWSTIIISEFINRSGLEAEWKDIRKILITDERYRDANVMWEESTKRIKGAFNTSHSSLYVTQGFIGGTLTGYATTLGREGSDYTAALLANILDAESVTVWKDVPGLLNADPKWLPDATKVEEMSYREAVEMTFSGAKVIHPKTIKPLQNKGIPLYVRSFVSPQEKGTVVNAEPALKEIIPMFIKKENQFLISFLPKDFSFVMGDNLGKLFFLFLQYGIKVNLVEASAVSIDVCVNNEREKIESLLEDLREEYSAVYNENVEILTIRHYTPEAISKIITGREILLEQRTRSTVRFVVKDLINDPE